MLHTTYENFPIWSFSRHCLVFPNIHLNILGMVSPLAYYMMYKLNYKISYHLERENWVKCQCNIHKNLACVSIGTFVPQFWVHRKFHTYLSYLKAGKLLAMNKLLLCYHILKQKLQSMLCTNIISPLLERKWAIWSICWHCFVLWRVFLMNVNK